MHSSPTSPSADPAAPGREAEEAGGTLVFVEMPKMGISVSEGTIVEWRKQPGDWVEADETIADVTTDKIDVEIPSPASGRVVRLAVEAGESVDGGRHDRRDRRRRPSRRGASGRGGQRGRSQARRPRTRPTGPASISPVVRRIAAKHDVDLSEVEGNGIGGRIRKQDVLAFIDAWGRRDETPQPVLHSESPYQPDPEPAPEGEAEQGTTSNEQPPAPIGDHREPMSAMRQAIARHMVDSRHTAAHCTTIVEVDMARVAARRAELKPVMARKGVSLTYLAFVAVATVEALERHPVLNASVEGDELVYHDDVNLGIAVALDEGLIVPVIRQAQRLSLEGMAVAIADLAERARSKRLDPDEVHGGTFTITNPGQFGAVLATPIINQPQVGILDLEAIVKRPVVITDQGGADSIASAQ